MKVLVVGGSWFVGRAVCDYYLVRGASVAVMNRGSRPVEGTTQLVADRDDGGAVRAALGELSFDLVVDSSCLDGPRARIIDQALEGRCGRYVQIGSASVYVDGADAPWRESSRIGGAEVWGSYGLGKYQAEAALVSGRLAARIPCVVLRPPYIYGAGNDFGRSDWLWARLLRGREVLIPARTTKIQLLHTRDLAQAVERAAEAPLAAGVHTFNVGGPDTIGMAEYVDRVAAAADVEARMRVIDWRRLGCQPRQFFPFRDTPCCVDTTESRRVLGFRPEVSDAEGLRETFLALGGWDLAKGDIDTVNEDAIAARAGRPA